MLVEALCSINSGQADKGDILDLCEDEARALIRSGAAREVSDEGNSASKKLGSPRVTTGSGSEEEAEKRKAELLEAIKLILESGENLTQGGKPKIAAIKEIVGFNTSAKELDSLLEELEEEKEE